MHKRRNILFQVFQIEEVKGMKTLLIALSLAVATIAQADPVQVSVTGTADSTTMGYTSGQSYTFNWVVSDGFSGGTGDTFSLGVNRWQADNPRSVPLPPTLPNHCGQPILPRQPFR